MRYRDIIPFKMGNPLLWADYLAFQRNVAKGTKLAFNNCSILLYDVIHKQH